MPKCKFLVKKLWQNKYYNVVFFWGCLQKPSFTETCTYATTTHDHKRSAAQL